ncbi:MAG: hypothetical protein HKO88_05345 [Xanthomonadales bacterium]|nr:hypothetical protein [Xanthomonadales bacterium]
MNRLMKNVLWLVMMLAGIPTALATDGDWPRTVPLEQGTVTIYPLKVDKLEAGTIHYRAALAYRATAGSEPVFGAGWFESPVEIDNGKRMVHPGGLKVTATRFPAGTYDVQAGLSSVLAQRSTSWNLDFPLDELDAALKTAEAESEALQNMNTAPPRIIYRDHPALLVSIDGDPVLREIENSELEAVINTPYPLIFDRKHYYLNAAKDVWYRADKATGPYRFETNPPADIVAMVNDAESESEAGEATGTVEKVTAANAPEIVVATEPAELIVTEGPAAFVPLVDDLLVLQNSDDDVFMHVGSQEFFIVRAGRWYRAPSLNGPWNFQASDDLPDAFVNIPQDSDQAGSRVYVAGTEEAREAVLDAEVPQTAAVKRGQADIEVKYDGEPVYAPVDGTDLVYIENTGSTVLKSGGLFYLVEDGVWYVATSPDGPWQVSDHRPQQIETILPTSPVYNTRYVRVYDSTPEVVYVGYTPGYVGSYVYHNTIFYGTGWYYRPWVSPYYYYPRHSTWGFNVSYNSWSGWNFGVSWGWGPFSLSYYSGGYWHRHHYWHHRHYGYWGPRGYRHRPAHYRNGHRRYAHDRYRHGSGRHRDYDRYSNGGHRSGGNQRHDNLYRDGRQRARVVDTRDRRTGTRDRYSGAARQANYLAGGEQRQRNYSGVKGPERNRTGPVRSAELRDKASVRDASFNANRNRRAADNGVTRQANYLAANRARQQNYSGIKKAERNRTQPVSSTDLRNKASVRDASSKARKSRLVADNNGTRRAGYTAANKTRQQNYSGIKKAERNRAQPVSSKELSNKASARDASSKASRNRQVADNSGARRTGYTASNKTRQQNYGGVKKAERNRVQPVNSTSLLNKANKRNTNAKVTRQTGRVTQTSSSRRTPKSTKSRATRPTVVTSPRQSQARSRNVQRQPSKAVKSPVRQSRPVVVNNRSTRQTSRVISAPVKTQGRSNAPRNAPTSSRKSPSPAKSTKPKSSGRASAKRASAKSHKGNSGRSGRSKR